MLRVTRNALVLVLGLTLFGDASVDADSDYYRVDVDRQHTRGFPGSGRSSSRYDIRIERPYSSTRKICNGSCINNPTISCAGGHHFVSVPGILNHLTQKHRRNRNLRAQTELLEAQTALLNYQLQQSATSRTQRTASATTAPSCCQAEAQLTLTSTCTEAGACSASCPGC